MMGSKMYVCVCKRITDRAIADSVLNGASSLSEVQRQLGVASQCGGCADLAANIIEDVQNQNNSFLPYAAA